MGDADLEGCGMYVAFASLSSLNILFVIVKLTNPISE